MSRILLILFIVSVHLSCTETGKDKEQPVEVSEIKPIMPDRILNPELSLGNLSWDERPVKIGGFIPDSLNPFSSSHA